MNIWIMRHGEAGFNAKTDSERKLTPQGVQTAFKQGQWLGLQMKNQQAVFDKVLVSPYTRTQQTFEALKQGMQAVEFSQNFANEVLESWNGITPSGSPTNVENYLDFLRDEAAKNVLIISHLPLVYDLVLQLTQQRQSVHFYPAVIAEIDWTRNTRQLRWVEKP